MSNIPLDKERGLNPAMAKCPRCGQDNGEIILLGKSNRYYCRDCQQKFVGYADGTAKLKGCPHCKSRNIVVDLANITDKDGPIMGGLCKACLDELAMFEEEIKKGGIRWRCQCGAMGVIKGESDAAKTVRRDHPETDWDKTGLEFPECPVCRKEV